MYWLVGGDLFGRPREIRFGMQISLTAAKQINRYGFSRHSGATAIQERTASS